MPVALLLFVLFTSILRGEAFVQISINQQLGNQFFMVAAGTSLALDNNAIPVFPDFITKSNDNIPLNYQEVFFRVNTTRPRIKNTKHFRYRYNGLQYQPIPYKPNMKLSGLFISEKYFINHKDHILNLFAPSAKIQSYLSQKYTSIIDHPNSVSIHYRDFTPEVKTGYFVDVDEEYYRRALRIFNANESIFVVFTNNPAKCKSILSKLPYNFIYIEGEPHYHDLYLMSMCKHNIICNSTFSWWGAYLNRNPNKIVISPARWFYDKMTDDESDILPQDWIRL